MLSLGQMTEDSYGRPYLSKEIPPKNDSLFATHTVNSIVLTCDHKKALKQAYEQGYNLIYLGKVNPQHEKQGFDLFSGSLDAYINQELENQKAKQRYRK